MIFPRILSGEAARVQDVFQQLVGFEQQDRARQTLSVERQLLQLMHHARAHSPFWRQRLDGHGFSGDGVRCLSRLPPLGRAQLRDQFDALRARTADMHPDQMLLHATSGSTGEPVRVEKYQPIYGPLFLAATLLDHHRHRRDSRKTLGTYSLKADDADALDWGAPLTWFGSSGPAYHRRLINRPVQELHAALVQHRPHYVSANPTVIGALAQAAEEAGGAAPRVEQFLSWAGPVSPQLRARVRRVFGAAITDSYSCEEVGHIAQQCARHPHLHVLSSMVMVEIVDEQNQPCPPGVVGRVLLTSLHGFALPLIRYEVGDLAQWGPDCDCGVRSPVIEKILGRTRDVVRLPDGSQRFVSFTDEPFGAMAPILEHQVILYADGVIELVCRAARALTVDERAQLAAFLQARFDHPFRVVIREVADVHRDGHWKRRDFIQAATAYVSGTAP